MEELRLPWNAREGVLYGGVIALITAFIMSTLNIAQNNGGLDAGVIRTSLISLPVIWVVVMLLMVFVVGRIANRGMRRFVAPTDGFNTRIVFNIIFCVTMMSASMSFLGPFVGECLSMDITWQCAAEWASRWPTNFFAAFWVEVLLAQPTARAVMKHLHLRQLRRGAEGQESVVNE
ncbi:MAG: hypothetical protein PHT00_00555 [Candidatus Methanomethylophilus sp.]|jgi:hypothetical protein|nr:hypothetical protein [Methanomethylophilus sp.]MDD3232649.1 hypothetical protein [Methanomethylophilus sp.]MDD4668525.1 hypothetical protein [Methanomethylophilus sp.]